MQTTHAEQKANSAEQLKDSPPKLPAPPNRNLPPQKEYINIHLFIFGPEHRREDAITETLRQSNMLDAAIRKHANDLPGLFSAMSFLFYPILTIQVAKRNRMLLQKMTQILEQHPEQMKESEETFLMLTKILSKYVQDVGAFGEDAKKIIWPAATKFLKALPFAVTNYTYKGAALPQSSKEEEVLSSLKRQEGEQAFYTPVGENVQRILGLLGDESANSNLVKSKIGLVITSVREAKDGRIAQIDQAAFAFEALEEAILSWQPESEVALDTFAKKYVQAALSSYLKEEHKNYPADFTGSSRDFAGYSLLRFIESTAPESNFLNIRPYCSTTKVNDEGELLVKFPLSQERIIGLQSLKDQRVMISSAQSLGYQNCLAIRPVNDPEAKPILVFENYLDRNNRYFSPLIPRIRKEEIPEPYDLFSRSRPENQNLIGEWRDALISELPTRIESAAEFNFAMALLTEISTLRVKSQAQAEQIFERIQSYAQDVSIGNYLQGKAASRFHKIVGSVCEASLKGFYSIKVLALPEVTAFEKNGNTYFSRLYAGFSKVSEKENYIFGSFPIRDTKFLETLPPDTHLNAFKDEGNGHLNATLTVGTQADSIIHSYTIAVDLVPHVLIIPEEPKPEDLQKQLARFDSKFNGVEEFNRKLNEIKIIGANPDLYNSEHLHPFLKKMAEFIHEVRKTSGHLIESSSINEVFRKILQTVPSRLIATQKNDEGAELDYYSRRSRYARDLNFAPKLTQIGEITLSLLIQQGDEKAYARFYEGSLWIALVVADFHWKKTSEHHYSFDQYLSWAVAAIPAGIRNFDPALGDAYLNYIFSAASKKINAGIISSINTIELSENVGRIVTKIKRAMDQLGTPIVNLEDNLEIVLNALEKQEPGKWDRKRLLKYAKYINHSKVSFDGKTSESDDRARLDTFGVEDQSLEATRSGRSQNIENLKIAFEEAKAVHRRADLIKGGSLRMSEEIRDLIFDNFRRYHIEGEEGLTLQQCAKNMGLNYKNPNMRKIVNKHFTEVMRCLRLAMSNKGFTRDDFEIGG